MNPFIQLKKAALVILVGLVLACFALPQRVHATDLGSVLPGGNTADGLGVLTSLTTGGYNTGTGWSSLKTVSNGSFNTGIGAGALVLNTGDSNTGVGVAALLLNTSGTQNVAVGTAALASNTAGSFNTANGVDALQNNTTGGNNTANGIAALRNNITGSDNTALGDAAGVMVTTANNVICIGAPGNNVDNSCYIGNIFSSTVTESAVFVNSNGRLGTMTSSKRFKEHIKRMDKASEAILALRPVTFRYKKSIDPDGVPQFGLVAEDVEKVNPDLVVRDKEGKPYSVRYDQVNAMLLNEFLKEHKKVEDLTKDFQTTVAQQQKQIEALTAGLQKVSAQLEASKPAPQVVNNP